jgi:hypothetical protein
MEAVMRIGKRIAAVLLLVLCGNAQERVVEPRYDLYPATRGDGLLRRAMLDGHNVARRAVGVSPLTWDDRLAASARGWADELARRGRMRHSEQRGRAGQGENLWTGTRGAYRYREMVGHWVDERRAFVKRPTPGFSRTGRWQDVGHYTQIVWRGTTAVGCAIAANARDEFLVCRYAPVGNVVGQRVF